MIGQTCGGIAAFLDAPFDTLERMRASTPGLSTALMALAAATLVMVVIDLVYGPLAFPHTMEPGGKRAFPYPLLAFVELLRALGTAAALWLGARLLLRTGTGPAEAVWMTVPHAVALVVFELLQAASWMVMIVTGVNLYGPVFVAGFTATILVLVVSVRALAPSRDWLGALPVAIAAFGLGYYVPYLVLPVAGLWLLALRVLRRI